MPASSIFSSETYRHAFRVPKGALVAVLLLVLVEVSVARSEWLYGFIPHSLAGAYVAVESQQIAAAVEPKVLFFGSSRVNDGISPRAFERAARLPRDSVVNLGLTVGTPLDGLNLYRRNREKLSSATHAFIGVDFFMLNRSFPLGNTSLRFASLSERFRQFEDTPRATVVMDHFWATLGARHRIRSALKAWWLDRPREPLRRRADGRMVWKRRKQDLTVARRRWQADKFLSDWKKGRGRASILNDLVATLQADGMNVLLFQVPADSHFWERARTAFHPAVRSYYGLVERVAKRRGIPFRSWEAPSDVGMADTDLLDYGHMTYLGAPKFSRVMVAEYRGKGKFTDPKGARAKKSGKKGRKKKKKRKKKKRNNRKRPPTE